MSHSRWKRNFKDGDGNVYSGLCPLGLPESVDLRSWLNRHNGSVSFFLALVFLASGKVHLVLNLSPNVPEQRESFWFGAA